MQGNIIPHGYDLAVLNFNDVIEAALGVDMIAMNEAKELYQKGFLTTSCCPSFVQYIKSVFPQLAEHISHNNSPVAVLAKYIKQDARIPMERYTNVLELCAVHAKRTTANPLLLPVSLAVAFQTRRLWKKSLTSL